MVAYGTENMENMILVICMFCFTLWIIYNTVIYVYFCFVFKLKYIISDTKQYLPRVACLTMN